MQETDTNRIAGGNSDLVRYFADNLGYYSYYGPKTVAGTFGIALLSRYPIENPRTVYLYSEGEQTAAIMAQINGFNVVVTHLGNDGPIVQQQKLLQEIDGTSSVLAMGDFNFTPDTEQYRLTRTKLDDAWLLKWPQGVDDRGYDRANASITSLSRRGHGERRHLPDHARFRSSGAAGGDWTIEKRRASLTAERRAHAVHLFHCARQPRPRGWPMSPAGRGL